MKIGHSSIDFKGLLIDGPAGLQSIEPKIMDLLRVLADNAGEVMTREDLITAVWGVEYGGDERLSRAISILRKALGDKRGQHTHIATISRVGYRLIADVSQNDVGGTPQKMTPNAAQSFTAAYPNKNKVPILSIKNLISIAALIVTCLTTWVFSTSAPRHSETLPLQAKMEQGFAHIENFTPKGAISEAQDIFSGILSENPDHAAARAGLAFSIAREYTYLERDPALLQRTKAHAEAALRQDEHLASANIAVAWAALLDGDTERANKYLDRADILDSDNILALEARYGLLRRQGEKDKAKELIDTAISSYPDHALFYTYRAGYFEAKGDLAASEADFRTAIALSPDNPRTYAGLAHILYSQNRTTEAIDVIQEGLNVDETALLYNNLGTYLFFKGQYALAASAFEKTLKLSGDTHDYLYWANLADSYRWSQDKKDEAATSYRRALQLLQTELDRYPDNVNLHSRAAMFNAKLGDFDKVQTHLDRFELTSDSPSVQLYRAVITYEIMSNRPKALKYLEAAMTANYPLIEILNDPELALLRQDPAYHKLLAKTQTD